MDIVTYAALKKQVGQSGNGSGSSSSDSGDYVLTIQTDWDNATNVDAKGAAFTAEQVEQIFAAYTAGRNIIVRAEYLYDEEYGSVRTLILANTSFAYDGSDVYYLSFISYDTIYCSNKFFFAQIECSRDLKAGGIGIYKLNNFNTNS